VGLGCDFRRLIKIGILLDLHCNNVQIQPEIRHAATQRETQRVSICWHREIADLFIAGL